MGTRMERKGGEKESFDIRPIMKEAAYKTRYCHSARSIISVDRRWRLQVASIFWRKTRRLPDDVVPRGEQRTRDEKKETGTGNRDGGGNGNEDEYGNDNEHQCRDGSENVRGNRDDNRDEGGEERHTGNLRRGNKGESEDARGGAISTSNQQPQPQDPTPQRDRRIMRKTRAKGREARDSEEAQETPEEL